MIAYVDVLGMRVESQKPGLFKCTRDVFKDFTVYIGLHADYVKFMLPCDLDEYYERDYVREGYRQGYVLSFGCKGASCDFNFEAQVMRQDA